ncbi:hypothetical protein FZI93_18030 [Mycobacterium sp. CBMA361]|nr:hypothetical protein [Mycolicibacterium sp. CBMA 361]
MADIRALGGADRSLQIALIARSQERIRTELASLRCADQYLSHVLQCVHPLLSECPECSDFARELNR